VNTTMSTVRTARLLAWLAVLISILSGAAAFAATVGDRIELTATHPAGMPFHRAAGGTPTFQRIPDGTIATVIGLGGGRWLQLRLADQRTGWISEHYVGRTIAGAPPPDTFAERLVWTSPQGCQQVVGRGGRMAPSNALRTELDRLTGGSWQVDLHACGSPSTQHVGFL
jgi:hypothetical protein